MRFPYGVLCTNLTFTKSLFFETKLLKIVTQTISNSSANPSYINLKVLILNKLNQHEVGKIIYNLYHKQHPYNLNQYFTKSNVSYFCPTCYTTSLMFTIPCMKSTKLQQSFLYQGVTTWNSIPTTSKFPLPLSLNLILNSSF